MLIGRLRRAGRTVDEACPEEARMTKAREQFQEFYQAVHATELLSPREKMFIGLAVTLTRTCEP
jgi:hypothetical protein